MDTEGYLRKHGWRGSGHSLDSTNKGLRKPLLISKKVDVLGVGINKHDVIADQWWMKAFDSSLKDFGTGKKSLLGQVKDHGVRRGGLYARFVQGEGVPGTIGVNPKSGVAVTTVSASKKRKADDGEETAVKKPKKEKTEKKKVKDTKDKKSKIKKEKTLAILPEDKRKQYAERAAAKGLSLDEYFAQRQVKNLAAKTSRRQPTSEPVSVTSDSGSTAEDKAKTKLKSSKKEGKESASEGSSDKTEDKQRTLANKLLQLGRRKLNGEAVHAAEADLPIIDIKSESGEFTEGERALALKTAKRVLKDKKKSKKEQKS